MKFTGHKSTYSNTNYYNLNLIIPDKNVSRALFQPLVIY